MRREQVERKIVYGVSFGWAKRGGVLEDFRDQERIDKARRWPGRRRHHRAMGVNVLKAPPIEDGGDDGSVRDRLRRSFGSRNVYQLTVLAGLVPNERLVLYSDEVGASV